MARDGAGPRHVHLAHIRFADLDPLNHVNNVQMLTYLEDARIAFLRWDSDIEGEGMGALVVARHEVDYVHQLLLRPEPVRVETWVRQVRNASFTLAYEIVDDTHVYLRASSVMVGFDPTTQGVRRLNEGERKYLARFLAT
ncbi:acyl-CoA thioesterase [Salinactinospora qingdaonensis]|uniref:Thioesterase family protein n=1 Tax=Salinactinospora qingdaonensis TaxID=702744 RepID=A0ABP7EV91_9ACTN